MLIYTKVYELSKKLREYVHAREYYNTLQELTLVYTGFPISVTEIMGSRGRLYTMQPFISRTAGSY